MTLTPVPAPGRYNPITNPYVDPPIVTVTPPYDTGFEIRPNQIYVFPVTLAADTRLVFNVMHTQNFREDFTLGCWFSTQPNIPVLFYENLIYDISIPRINRAFALQDINYTGSMVIPPVGTSTISVIPGEYFFNVQNRVNGLNKFEFLLQTVELT